VIVAGKDMKHQEFYEINLSKKYAGHPSKIKLKSKKFPKI